MSKSFSAKPKLANWIVNIREFVDNKNIVESNSSQADHSGDSGTSQLGIRMDQARPTGLTIFEVSLTMKYVASLNM